MSLPARRCHTFSKVFSWKRWFKKGLKRLKCGNSLTQQASPLCISMPITTKHGLWQLMGAHCSVMTANVDTTAGDVRVCAEGYSYCFINGSNENVWRLSQRCTSIFERVSSPPFIQKTLNQTLKECSHWQVITFLTHMNGKSKQLDLMLHTCCGSLKDCGWPLDVNRNPLRR